MNFPVIPSELLDSFSFQVVVTVIVTIFVLIAMYFVVEDAILAECQRAKQTE